jgi:hypothetical protein
MIVDPTTNYTAWEVAAHLKVSVDHVRALCRTKELNAIDVSRRGSRKTRWRIRGDALMAYEDRQKPGPEVKRLRTRRLPQVMPFNFSDPPNKAAAKAMNS